MRKIKRLLTIGLSIFLAMGVACVAACQSMGDIVPEEYGEWDNNYVYRGNGRSKTTGEGYEQLVESVEIDGKAHKVLACADSEIKGDTMYMILACQKEGKAAPAIAYSKEVWEREVDLLYCLVEYNIQAKTQQLLTTDLVVEEDGKEYFYRPARIEAVLDEHIVMMAYREKVEYIYNGLSCYEKVWYTLDLDGNMLDPSMENGEEWAHYEWVSEDYLLAEIYNEEKQQYELTYRTGDLSPAVLMYSYYSSSQYRWAYVEENGVQGVLFQKYDRIKDRNGYERWQLRDIEFYNFATNTKSEISVNQRAEFFGNYTYLRTFSEQTIEYRGLFWKKETAVVEKDNAIYRIVYDESGIRLEEFFDLTEKYDYMVYGVHEDKLLYYEAWYQNAIGCNCFGFQSRYVVHDLVSGKKTEIEFEEVAELEDDFSALYEKERGVVVGQYTYFLHEEKFQPLMGMATYGYLLKRVNNQTNEVEVMQCWNEDKTYESSTLTLKFCEELWFTCGSNYNREFDFYEFTVRAY